MFVKLATNITQSCQLDKVTKNETKRRTLLFLFIFTMLKASLRLRCDKRFQRAFTAHGCVFKVITFVGSNQGNFFDNTIACSKRTLKTTVATQLKKKVRQKQSNEIIVIKG